MGGEGAASGVSKNNIHYGQEYERVFDEVDNIKFIKTAMGQNTTAPKETQTKDRIYVTVDNDLNPKYITFYDDNGKRYKQIDLSGPAHIIDGEKVPPPHVHYGYNHDENGSGKTTAEDDKLIERVYGIWRANITQK